MSGCLLDLAAALRWGALMGEGQAAGLTPPSDDAKIAAIAAVHGLTVVTGNVRAFAPLGVPCPDPAAWLPEPGAAKPG